MRGWGGGEPGGGKIGLKRWGGVCELAPNLMQLISIGSII